MGTRWAGMSESMRGRDTNKKRRTSRTASRIHLHSTSAFLSSSSPTQQPSLPPHTHLFPPQSHSLLSTVPSPLPVHEGIRWYVFQHTRSLSHAMGISSHVFGRIESAHRILSKQQHQAPQHTTPPPLLQGKGPHHT